MGEGTLAWFERVRYMFEMADAASFGNRTLEHVQVDWKRSTTPPLPPPARGNVWGAGTISLGLPIIDRHLPSGGLTRAALHEVAGSGPEAEHGAAAALFIAGLLGRLEGPVLWVLERPDLFAPALAGVGLSPDRVIYAEAGRPDTVLPTMEEGLRHPGLAGVVGEISGRLTLTASRRLQLASEGSGVIGFALRRSRRHNDPILADPIAAMTRWRLGFLPSPPPFADAPDVPGLGRALWHLRLIRCRGGEPASWVVEACNATGHLRLAAEPAGRQVARRLSASG